jgi:hypothetical protein
MGKVLKGVLLGGAVGAAVAVLQSTRRQEADDQVMERALKGAAEAALVGGAIGFILDRRARARARAAAAAAPVIVQYARRAKPVVDSALELVMDAAEAARPHVERAATVARERATDAAEAARPHVEHAAAVARERASDAAEAAADAARPHVQKASKAARKRVEPLVEGARDRAADLADAAARHVAVDSNGHGAPKQIVLTLA